MIVLAVDDDSDDLEFFFEAVRKIDDSIIVLKASNGHEALDVLENHILLPDFIFLDINMPMMDGDACLRQIRQNDKLKDLRVVMYSTSNNNKEIAKYKSMGAGFLVKPHQFSKLVKSLSVILGYSNGQAEYFYILGIGL